MRNRLAKVSRSYLSLGHLKSQRAYQGSRQRQPRAAKSTHKWNAGLAGLCESILVPEKLEYPLSMLGKGCSQVSRPEIDFAVEVELVQRASSDCSSGLLCSLAKLTCKLESGVTDDLPCLVSMRKLPHCRTIF
jgi:hypothetical protein